jgi:hypothetical protein
MEKGLADLLKYQRQQPASASRQTAPGSSGNSCPSSLSGGGGAAPIPTSGSLHASASIASLRTFNSREDKLGVKSWLNRPVRKIVYNLSKIGNVHLWLDCGCHNTDEIMISHMLEAAFEAAKLIRILYFGRNAA